MTTRRKNKAPREGGALQKQLSLGMGQQYKPSADPREVQGIATKRHADQRPPRWEPPRGWTAAELLDSLWGPLRDPTKVRR